MPALMPSTREEMERMFDKVYGRSAEVLGAGNGEVGKWVGSGAYTGVVVNGFRDKWVDEEG
jgi:hypothetical protein